MHRDVYGEALSDYHCYNKLNSPLLLYSSYGDVDEMPIEVFFREEEDYPELEHIALSLCDGHVLDIGAGAGSHALTLQERNFKVTALEISDIACRIMQERGVNRILHQDFFTLTNQKYDTLLFLMNGIGLSGTIDGFKHLLRHSRSLLSNRGQLLFDTSDISYLYNEHKIQRPDHYFGEITYQYEYHTHKALPFQWLYLDQNKLIEIAHEENWVVQILFEDEYDQYLVRMEPKQA